ncbi:HEAT repeat domain-containing protein [Schlesneria paludicola]|uniref:HEAT repeat domain-containing protein n=1 Tax=Schlesneria paludicola TaxID=360056 RepID=UPI00029B217C|nr:HEAT repeat domain-containing protein [Schlesneria paludicola]
MQLRAIISVTLICLMTSLATAADSPLVSLKNQLREGSSAERVAATQKLGEMGLRAASAVPALLTSLESEDLPLQHVTLMALGQINSEADLVVPALIRMLSDKSPLLRHGAIESLRMYGVDARPALPQLRKLMEDSDAFVKIEAARAVVDISSEPIEKLEPASAVLISGLSHVSPGINQVAAQGLISAGKSAVPAVQKLLSGSNPAITNHACDVLGMIGPDSAEAVDRLLVLAESKDPDASWHAIRALGAIGAKPDQVVPILTKQLQNEVPVVRMHSAHALGAMGAAAAPAVPSLITALKDKDESVRRAAVSSLGRIGPAAEKAVPALITALDDASGSVTLDVAMALGRIGKPAVPALIEKLKTPGYQQLIAGVLEDVGPNASAAVPALTGLVSAGNPELSREAIMALAAIGPAASSAVPELSKVLKDPKSTVAPAAAFALGRIGAKQACPALRESLNAPNNPMLRLASVWALLQLEPNNEEYIKIGVPRLAEALSSDRPRVRREAATTLGRIGQKAQSAVPALRKSLKDEDPEVRMESLVALAEIGPDCAVALDDIVTLLNEGDPAFVPVAIYACGQIGVAAKSAVPLLKRLLQSRDPVQKTVAAWALVKIDPNPETIKTAIPLLVTALQTSGRVDTRVVAARTLGEIGAGSTEAREALVTAKKDENESVRKAADEAIAKLK